MSQVICPFADHSHDGIVCIHFSLPIPVDPLGATTAKILAERMGLLDVRIVHSRELDEHTSHYTIYARTDVTVSVDCLGSQSAYRREPSRENIIAVLREQVPRTLVVVAAACGSEAHTVGLNAILGAKGFKGEPGLETYPGFKIIHLGRQIEPDVLVAAIRQHDADIALVSQTVSQQGLHENVLRAVISEIELQGMRDGRIVVCGGASITEETAQHLGYDGSFGPGTTGRSLAAFIVEKLPTLNPRLVAALEN